MSKLTFYVVEKELEFAEKLLSMDYIESIEIHDKEQDSGYVAEVVASGYFDEQDLLWIGMELGSEFTNSICWSKYSK